MWIFSEKCSWHVCGSINHDFFHFEALLEEVDRTFRAIDHLFIILLRYKSILPLNYAKIIPFYFDDCCIWEHPLAGHPLPHTPENSGGYYLGFFSSDWSHLELDFLSFYLPDIIQNCSIDRVFLAGRRWSGDRRYARNQCCRIFDLSPWYWFQSCCCFCFAGLCSSRVKDALLHRSGIWSSLGSIFFLK